MDHGSNKWLDTLCGRLDRWNFEDFFLKNIYGHVCKSQIIVQNTSIFAILLFLSVSKLRCVVINDRLKCAGVLLVWSITSWLVRTSFNHFVSDEFPASKCLKNGILLQNQGFWVKSSDLVYENGGKHRVFWFASTFSKPGQLVKPFDFTYPRPLHSGEAL